MSQHSKYVLFEWNWLASQAMPHNTAKREVIHLQRRNSYRIRGRLQESHDSKEMGIKKHRLSKIFEHEAEVSENPPLPLFKLLFTLLKICVLFPL